MLSTFSPRRKKAGEPTCFCLRATCFLLSHLKSVFACLSIQCSLLVPRIRTSLANRTRHSYPNTITFTSKSCVACGAVAWILGGVVKVSYAFSTIMAWITVATCAAGPHYQWKKRLKMTSVVFSFTSCVFVLVFSLSFQWNWIEIGSFPNRIQLFMVIVISIFKSYSSRTCRIWTDIYNQRGRRPIWLLSPHIQQVREE